MVAPMFVFSVRPGFRLTEKFLMLFIAKNGKFLHFCKLLLKMENIVKFVNSWDCQILPFSDHYFLQILPLENIVSLPCWLEMFNCKYMVVYVYSIQVVKWLTCCVKSGIMVILGWVRSSQEYWQQEQKRTDVFMQTFAYLCRLYHTKVLEY